MLKTNAQLGLEADLTLSRALLVYQERSFTGGQRSFVTVHGVDTEDDTPSLCEGRLLTHGDLRELVRGVSGIQGLRYLPSHILAYSPDGLAWWSEASRASRPLFFRTQDDCLNGLSGQHFPQPPLVFIARERRLSVFALITNERPTADTELCFAPYYNVYSNGVICLGSMPRPDTLESGNTHVVHWASLLSSHETAWPWLSSTSFRCCLKMPSVCGIIFLYQRLSPSLLPPERRSVARLGSKAYRMRYGFPLVLYT